MQPDTIIPDPSNPQGWNRFSYVGNNPLGYSDPSGHVRVADLDPGRRGCSDPDYCENGKPKPPVPLPPVPPRVDQMIRVGSPGDNQNLGQPFGTLPNIRLETPFDICVSGCDPVEYSFSPVATRISTRPSLTINNGSQITVGSGRLIFSGQNGNLSTRFTVNDERNTGFGVAAIDNVADNIQESTGLIVSPTERSITITASVTMDNVTVTVPGRVDIRSNPHGLVMLAVAAAIILPGSIPAVGYAACKSLAAC